MKLSHAVLIGISGAIWLAVGCFLLPLGIKLMMTGAQEANIGVYYPILTNLSPYLGGVEQVALWLTVVSLFVGYMKGRTVFAKSVKRSVNRIRTLPDPTSLGNIYSPAYYILLGSMVALGMGIKFLGLSYDIRGAVDIAIGSALINGAVLYFREAAALKRA